MGAKFTEAQANAQKNYRGKIKVIQLTLKPEEKERIKEAATSAGKSVNGYIKRSHSGENRKGSCCHIIRNIKIKIATNIGTKTELKSCRNKKL